MGTSDLLQRYPILHPAAATRTIEGEAVVVTPHDSSFHTLNDVGSRILALADGTRSGLQIAWVIVAEYEVEPADAERDVESFVEALVEKGILLVLEQPVAGPGGSGSASRGTP